MNARIKLPLSELESAIKVLTQRPKRELVGDRKHLTVVLGGDWLELSYAGAMTRLRGSGDGASRAVAQIEMFKAAVHKQRSVAEGDVEVSADEDAIRIGDFSFTPTWFGPRDTGARFDAGLIPEPHDALDLQVAYDAYPFAVLEANGLDRLALDATNAAKAAIEGALKVLSAHGLDAHCLLQASHRGKQARFRQWQAMGCDVGDPYAEPGMTPADDGGGVSGAGGVHNSERETSNWQETQLRRPVPGGVGRQGYLFTESLATLKQRLGIDGEQLARWRGFGWLSSSVEQEEQFEDLPFAGMEVEFIHGLADLGFDDVWITELLEGLDRPYSYRYQQMLLQLPNIWWSPCPPEEAAEAWWEFLGSHHHEIVEAEAAEGQAGALIDLLRSLVCDDGG